MAFSLCYLDTLAARYFRRVPWIIESQYIIFKGESSSFRRKILNLKRDESLVVWVCHLNCRAWVKGAMAARRMYYTYTD